MIRLVEREQDQRRLLALCEKTAFGCKIASWATAYGFDKSFACFWLDTEADVEIGRASCRGRVSSPV